MLALNPRFAILATFCSLAAVTLSPVSTVAIAVNPRHSEAKEATTSVHHQKQPTVPLPAATLRKSKSAAAKKGAKKTSASAGEKHKSDGGRFKRDFVVVEARRHRGYGKIIIDSKHGIWVGPDRHSNYGRELEKVIVKGKDAHIHVEDHDHSWPHGEKIIVKGSNAHVHGRRSIAVLDDQHIGPQATFKVRRDDQAAPVPGTVLIMSPVYNSSDREIAALYMDTSTDEYVLNASDTQRTALSLAKASIPSSQNSEDSDVAVFLQTMISSNSSSTPVPHCATYDPKPAQAEPMKMTPCDNTTTADAHRSQVFAYNERTGAIRPMTLLEDEGPNNATSPSAPSNDDNSWNSTAASNGTTSSNSTAPSNGTTSAATASSTPGTFGRIDAALTGSQNVILKFVPDDVMVEDTQDPASNGTMTTTTVTVTNTASESASTQSLSAADVTSATDEPVSSTLSSGTLTASAASGSSTTDGASPSSTSAGALKVEVISPSDSSSASTTQSTTSASSTTVASSSIDAAAVASSIASSNAAASSSSTINASSSPTSAPTAVAISGRDGVAAPKLTPASTAPYKWMFKAESR